MTTKEFIENKINELEKKKKTLGGGVSRRVVNGKINVLNEILTQINK